MFSVTSFIDKQLNPIYEIYETLAYMTLIILFYILPDVNLKPFCDKFGSRLAHTGFFSRQTQIT